MALNLEIRPENDITLRGRWQASDLSALPPLDREKHEYLDNVTRLLSYPLEILHDDAAAVRGGAASHIPRRAVESMRRCIDNFARAARVSSPTEQAGSDADRTLRNNQALFAAYAEGFDRYAQAIIEDVHG